MRKLFIAVLAVALSSGALTAAEETTYGAGVTLATATPIAMLLAHPEEYAGKKVRVDGVVTAVCENMGCWMAISDENTKQTLKFRVAHGAVVFPVAAKGKKASAEGTFDLAEKVSALINHTDETEKSHHAAEPAKAHHGATPPHKFEPVDAPHDAPKAAAPVYEIHATGAVIQ